MKRKLLSVLLCSAMVMGAVTGCNKNEPVTKDATTVAKTKESKSDAKVEDTTIGYKAIADIDVASLAGTTVSLYTHGGNRVLGEEKKDAAGNTYRDEAYAYLKHLSERFEKKYSIHVDLQVVSTEDELKPLFQSEDDSVDIYTSPNWKIEEWQEYAEPYCTLDEARELYGEYAETMYNDGEFVYALMPAKTYNNAVVYNETAIKSVGYDTIPTTQAEFETMCTKLRGAGINPIGMHRVENWPLATLRDFANYVDGSNIAFNSMLECDTPFSAEAPMGKTIKMYTNWKSKGFFEEDTFTDFGVAMDSVAKGETATMLFGAWLVPQLQGRVPAGADPLSIKFAPAPDFGKGQYIIASAADSYAISKASKNKDAARLLIEYISEDAQYLADSGYIANKKGVAPIVPGLYSIIDDAVKAGTCKVLYVAPTDENAMNNQNVLSEAGLMEDEKYAGNLFDTLDITKPDDWSAYDKQVEVQNAAFVEARKALGVSWTK